MIRTNKGFTLVELMVVIVIIGILAALAIPKFTDASLKAKCSEAPTVIASCENATLARFAESGALPTAWTDLVCENPEANGFSKWFTYVGGFNASWTVTATGGNGMPGGDLISTIDGQGVLQPHTRPASYDKYLPNF